MITMLLYVLFSQTASDFPIHTLRLLHSLALASQLTLPLASLCLFPPFETRGPKRPWPGSRGHFPRNYPLKKDRRHIDVPVTPNSFALTSP